MDNELVSSGKLNFPADAAGSLPQADGDSSTRCARIIRRRHLEGHMCRRDTFSEGQ